MSQRRYEVTPKTKVFECPSCTNVSCRVTFKHDKKNNITYVGGACIACRKIFVLRPYRGKMFDRLDAYHHVKYSIRLGEYEITPVDVSKFEDEVSVVDKTGVLRTLIEDLLIALRAPYRKAGRST